MDEFVVRPGGSIRCTVQRHDNLAGCLQMLWSALHCGGAPPSDQLPSDNRCATRCPSAPYAYAAKYTVSHKNVPSNFRPYLRQISTDFYNFFTDTLCEKFGIRSLLNIPPHHNSKATLPCEIQIIKNHHSQTKYIHKRRAIIWNHFLLIFVYKLHYVNIVLDCYIFDVCKQKHTVLL